MTLRFVADWMALLVTFALTGGMLGVAVIPERLGAGKRTLLSLALAIPATILIAVPAVSLRRLNALTFAFGLCVLAAVAFFRNRERIVRSVRTRTTSGIPVQFWRSRLWSDPWRVLILLSAAVAGWFAVLGPQIASRRPDGLPWGSTVWYYWWVVKQVYSEGGVPRSAAEWGSISRPFPVEYLGAALHGAISTAVSGQPDLLFLERYRVAMAILGLLAFYALWRVWMPPWWSWIASLLTLSSERLAPKFLTYWPETFGLLLVVWSGWLLEEAMRRRSARWMMLAGLVSGTSYISHAEIWLLTGPLWLGIVLSRVVHQLRPLKRGDFASVRGATGATLRSIRSPGVRLFAACFLAWLVTVAGTAVSTGGGARMQQLIAVGGTSEEAQVQETSDDPTWSLHSAMYDPRWESRGAPTFCNRMLSLGVVRRPYERLDLRSTWALVALGTAGGLLLVMSPRLSTGLVAGIVVWLVYVLGVYAGSSVICARYDTFVPERAGYLRILPNYVIALSGFLAALAWLATSLLYRRLRSRLRGEWARVVRLRIVAAAATSIVSAFVLLSLTPLASGRIVGPDYGLSPVAYEALTWLEASTPADTIVLANSYTAGSIASVSGRVGVLDGRAPYLEPPAWRGSATQALLDSRAFFADPVANCEKLPKATDYVLLSRGVSLAGAYGFRSNLSGLQQLPGLRLARSFGRSQVFVFEVVKPNGSENGTVCPPRP